MSKGRHLKHKRSSSSLLEELLPEPENANSTKRTLSTAVLAVWLIVICWLGLSSTSKEYWIGSWAYSKPEMSSQQSDLDMLRSPKHKLLDYGQYKVWHKDLNWKTPEKGRLIVIGDVHGQIDELKELLSLLNFKKDQDTVVLAGDLIAKHPSVHASLKVLDYARSINAKAIRGNHDQYSIFWRSWLEANRKTLNLQPSQTFNDSSLLIELEVNLDSDAAEAQKLLPFPSDWKKHQLHFRIAKALSQAQFDYLSSLPLTFYIENLNAFIVHAGLLPRSITKSKYLRPDGAPTIAQDPTDSSDGSIDLPEELLSGNPAYFTPSTKLFGRLKASPVKSVLLVEQNRDPYTLIEVRDVEKGGVPSSKASAGKDWHKIWNKAQRKCAKRSERTLHKKQLEVDPDEIESIVEEDDAEGDMEAEEDPVDVDAFSKTCPPPTNIIYGHWKAQGLNIQDYTFGLDSGCVYGGQLSALVLSSIPFTSNRKDVTVKPIQIHGQKAQIVSLDCTRPRDGPV